MRISVNGLFEAASFLFLSALCARLRVLCDPSSAPKVYEEPQGTIKNLKIIAILIA